MLSISPAKSSAQAKNYYERDNYYIKADAGDIQSEWFGVGATRLGLTGEVNGETFVALLEGKLPNGQQLGISKHGEYQHRPGYDLTFSAPKSISILAEIGGDKRLIEAHDQAVTLALAEIEQLATARRSISGTMTYELTKNLIVARFHHGTSRALDPQLHTHAVVLNVTQRQDGKLVSLASQSKHSIKREGRVGFMEQVYARKMHFGMVYRAALAQAVVKLGYTIRHTHGDGRFEIEGVLPEAIQAFSQRRETIEASLEERGLQGAKASEQAALKTREHKRDVDKISLLVDWKERALALGLSPHVLIEQSKEKQVNLKVKSPEEIQALAREAVDYARKHLAERQSAFLQDELQKVALSHALGELAPVDVRLAIDGAITQGLLIAEQYQDAKYLTTPEAKALEQHNIELMLRAKGKVSAISDFHRSSPMLWGHGLNKGQFEAASLVVTTEDGVIGIQGYAGTGKTTLLKAVNELADMMGFDVRGMAPSAAAAVELAKGSGIASQTLDSFLIEMQKVADTSTLPQGTNQLWVLDESSLTSSRAKNELLLLRESLGAHLVLLGDIQQQGAVESGKPFEQLQQAGMATAIVNKIVRQKNLNLMQAVYAIIDGDVPKALNKVSDFIQEIEDKTERLSTIAGDYLALSQDERKETLVVAQTNDDRQTINRLIREGLREEDSLQGVSINTEILVNKGLTLVEQTRAKSYEVGDFIKFNKDIGGFKKGEYYRVAERHLEDNQLRLELSDRTGKKVTSMPFSPIQQGGGSRGVISVFEKETRSLAKGDVIRWTLNQRSLKRINATTGVVQSINAKQAKILDDNGKMHTIKLHDKRDQHYDYGYVWTVYAAQGKTVNRVLAHDQSTLEFLANQKGFYVIISRARHEARLYIDNQEAYASKLEASLGDKVAALEIVPNSPRMQAPTLSKSDRVKEAFTPSHPTSKQSSMGATYQKLHLSGETSPTKPITRSKMMVKPAPESRYDIDRIYTKLVDMAPFVVERMLGEPNRQLSNKTTWRYGKKGSFAVTVSGSKAGLWHDFEKGENGNLFQLISKTACLSFKDTLAMAAELTGIQHRPLDPIHAIQLKSKSISQGINIPSPEDQKAMAYAASIIKKSQPIEGTLAQMYLQKHRGITLEKYPKSLRFIPAMRHSQSKQNYPALLSIATNAKGEVQAVQVTYLDSKTHNKADLVLNKVQYGRMKFGAQVLLQQGTKPYQEVIVAEGVETALSLAMAKPEATVMATLSVSNMRHVTLPQKAEHIIIGADNDKGKDYAMTLLQKSITALQTKTEKLSIAIPDKEQTDFNDVLKQTGITTVKTLLTQSETIDISPANEQAKEAVLPPKMYEEKSRISVEEKTQVKEQDVNITPTLRAPISTIQSLQKEPISHVKDIDLEL